MKVLEDDCEAGWTMKKLELGCKVTPLASERNGAIERVTRPDHSRHDGGNIATEPLAKPR